MYIWAWIYCLRFVYLKYICNFLKEKYTTKIKIKSFLKLAFISIMKINLNFIWKFYGVRCASDHRDVGGKQRNIFIHIADWHGHVSEQRGGAPQGLLKKHCHALAASDWGTISISARNDIANFGKCIWLLCDNNMCLNVILNTVF